MVSARFISVWSVWGENQQMGDHGERQRAKFSYGLASKRLNARWQYGKVRREVPTSANCVKVPHDPRLPVPVLGINRLVPPQALEIYEEEDFISVGPGGGRQEGHAEREESLCLQVPRV